MAHFYATVTGNRGAAKKLGTQDSGIQAHVRGWNIGAKVDISHEDGEDVVRIYKTSGSNERKADELLAVFREKETAASKVTRWRPRKVE